MTITLHALFADTLNITEDNVSEQTAPGNTEEWDSLNNMILLAAIEETYEVELNTQEITNMKSVGDVRNILQARGIDVE